MTTMTNDKSKDLLGGFHHTAERANKMYLWNAWHYYIYTDDGCEEGECVIPDIESAREYIEARTIRMNCYGGTPDLLPRRYTSEEVDRYYKKERKLEKRHMDLRAHAFTGTDGKIGLKDILGKEIVPAKFDGIPERYDYFDTPRLIPVINDGRYYLYDHEDGKLVSGGYDRIFRYVWCYVDYFVAVNGNKKGILDGYDGHEIVPVEMDEVYQMQDSDSFIPLVKDGKVGACEGDAFIEPIYDKMQICSEEYAKVWLNGKQGWLDHSGRFTQNEEEACYGSWYDSSK